MVGGRQAGKRRCRRKHKSFPDTWLPCQAANLRTRSSVISAASVRSEPRKITFPFTVGRRDDRLRSSDGARRNSQGHAYHQTHLISVGPATHTQQTNFSTSCSSSSRNPTHRSPARRCRAPECTVTIHGDTCRPKTSLPRRTIACCELTTQHSFVH